MKDYILKWTKKFVSMTGIVASIVAICLTISNLIVIETTKMQVVSDLNSDQEVISEEQLQTLRDMKPECIIVLGASVHSDGTPSPMLRQRLDAAIELYEAGVAPAMLLSGDNGCVEYNELSVMAKYAQDNGVACEDIFCDYAGFSTYETIYRAKRVFDVDRAVVTTQKYHLYRALYGCNRVGIEALGVGSDPKVYKGQSMRDGREVLARNKDCLKWITRAKPKYLGAKVPISGPGNCEY